MKVKILFAILLLVLSCVDIKSQISLKTEYFGASSYRNGETNEKVGDAKGSAMVYQGRVGIPLSMKMNENNRPTMWSIGAGASYASLDNKNFGEDQLISDILNMQLALMHMRPINDKWSLLASVGVGVYTNETDLSKIRGKHILGSGGVIFIRHLKPNLSLGGGLAFNNTFGYPMVFPALYLDWRLDGKFKFKTAMIDGIEIAASYDCNKYLGLNVVAEMNGQMALLEKDKKDMMFTHQYMVVGFRPEFRIGKKVSIPLTAGIHAIRSAYYAKRSLKAMFSEGDDFYFQVSPYASVGLNIGF